MNNNCNNDIINDVLLNKSIIIEIIDSIKNNNEGAHNGIVLEGILYN
jgi:hypothetical protein